jgi:uncharacterized protein YjbJ (UPF0337 family)
MTTKTAISSVGERVPEFAGYVRQQTDDGRRTLQTQIRKTAGERDVLVPWRSSVILKDTEMNWDQIEGNWKQFKGDVKQQWGKLTDDQLDVIAGKRDKLAGKIQEAYGISKDIAEKQLTDWQKRQKEIAHVK